MKMKGCGILHPTIRRKVNQSKSYGYIYLVANSINDIYYIGQHKFDTTQGVDYDVVSKYSQEMYEQSHGHEIFKIDPNYKGSGTLLWRAINKYGWDKFYVMDILDVADSPEELDYLEFVNIRYYKRLGKQLYNISDGGHTPRLKGIMNPNHHLNSKRITDGKSTKYIPVNDPIPLGWYLGISEETHRLKSEAVKGEKNPMYGRHHSEESNQKNRESHLGKKASLETRRLMSENRKNNPKFRPPNLKGRIAITNGEVTKMINPEDFTSYASLGYYKGRAPR